MSRLERRFNKFARNAYHLSGKVLLAKLKKGEGFGTSSAGAKGYYQFMPTTRQEVKAKYGLDPWRSEGEARKAAMHHLLGDLGHHRGLTGYNPGDPSYPSYILKQDVGEGGQGGTPGRNPTPTTRTTKTTTQTRAPYIKKGGITQDTTSAVLDAVQAPHKPGGIVKGIINNLSSGQYDTYTPDKAVKGKFKTTTRTTRSSSGSSSEPRGAGSGKLHAVNDQTGVNDYVHDYVRRMTGLAGDIQLGTGKVGHSKYVKGTNRLSDHGFGNAVDLPATGKRGDRIAYAAFRAAGLSPKRAHSLAQKGGLYNFQHEGYRIQIIWKTMEGGDHYTHVHVGVKPV